MATITPKTISHYIEYRISNIEKSIDLISLAAHQGKLPSRSGHIWSFTKTIVAEPFTLALRVVEFAFFAFALVASIPFGRKGSTRLNFLNVICYQPLNIGCKVVSGVARISATVLGLASPKHAANVWLWANRLDLSAMRNHSKFLTDSFPAKTTTEFSIKWISPFYATWYLGGDKCKEIEQDQHGAALSKLDEEIKDALSERIVALQTKFPEEIAGIISKCVSKILEGGSLYLNFANFSIPDNADAGAVKNQMARLSTKNLQYLDAVVQSVIASKTLQVSLELSKSNEPQVKADYEQLTEDLNVRKDDLEIAFSYREGFGCVKLLK